MSIVEDKLKLLEDYLQKNVTFCIDTKTVRRGRLLLYNIKDYYIKFLIRTNKNINKNYELPYPYDITEGVGCIKLTYKIKDLCRDNDMKEEFVRSYTPVENSKLYDKTVIITNIGTN